MTTEKRIGVTIATPLRNFRDPKDADPSISPEDRAKALAKVLPPQIGRALRELHERRAEHPYTFNFAAYGGGLCSARNLAVEDFLKSEDAFFLTWDADLHDQAGKEADAILRLLSWRQPIVGGLYPRRIRRRAGWAANFLPAAKLQLGGLLQCAELGEGFKLRHRKVFEELLRIYGTDPLKDKAHGAQSFLYRDRDSGEMHGGFYQIRVVEGDLLSEDYFLDYLCRCAQIPILADTVVRLRQRDVHTVSENGVQGEVVTWFPAHDQPWPPIPAEDAQ